MKPDGNVAFITGGAQGFGRALGKALLERGAKVCLADVNDKQGKQTKDELQSETENSDVMFVLCDVTNHDSFKDAVGCCVKQFGTIDIFVNNAGICDEINWQKCVDVNLNGVIRGTNLALERMQTNKGGNGGIIINVSSVAGFIRSHAIPTYSATKSGVIAYTTRLASNPETNGVHLMCICPSFAKTAILSSTDKVLDSGSIKDLMVKMGLLEVETVIAGFLKLIEDNINGSVLSVTMEGTEYKQID